MGRFIGFIAVIGLCIGCVALTVAYARTNRARVGPAEGALHAPVGLRVVASPAGAVLSWRPVKPYPLGYKIYRAEGLHGPFAFVGATTDSTARGFVDQAGIVSGLTYVYKVTAYNLRGESRPAGPVYLPVLIVPTPTVLGPTPIPTFAPPSAPTLTAITLHPCGSRKSCR